MFACVRLCSRLFAKQQGDHYYHRWPGAGRRGCPSTYDFSVTVVASGKEFHLKAFLTSAAAYMDAIGEEVKIAAMAVELHGGTGSWPRPLRRQAHAGSLQGIGSA